MAATPRVVVVGGGIAGLSVLAGLARAGVPGVLLERAPVIGAHASGRNAAIHRSLERDATTARLVARSRALMDALADGGHLRRTGLLLTAADDARVQGWAQHAAAQGVAHRAVDAADLQMLAPHLAGGEASAGVWVEDGGVLDIHAMLLSLAAQSRAAGAVIRTGVRVGQILVDCDRVVGVRLGDGEHVRADHVVLAAGAWARGLGAACGCALPLTPMRRHLVQLSARLDPSLPVVWRLDEEVYLRPEGSGTLCSPCDETPWSIDPPPDDPPADPAVLELLADKLARSAPQLAGAAVQRHWACLRTFAPDRELVAGPDPRLPGLHWLSGFGGRGMSVGPAVGALCAGWILGHEVGGFDALGVARLVTA